ncbi:hypothetical protein [Clostridium thailandense]|uniref:hypothetical protein n=1 Tax=Clostridium thailandense TaxID=2794346 RepID=UPI003989FC21
MDTGEVKNELHNFIDELYDNLKEIMNECSSIEEINEGFYEEHKNITDYTKKLELDILNKFEGEDKIKTKIIHIPFIQIDEKSIYVKEDEAPVIVKEKSKEKKPSKTIVVTSAIIIGFLFGIIIKRGNILNGIIMGFIGAAFGFSAYEMYFAEDNDNLEKLIERDKKINKRLDREYLGRLIDERKKGIEDVLIKLIDDYSNDLNKKSEN